MAIWALITYPPDLSTVIWCYVNVAQMCIGSMVPLLLQIWIKAADVWAFLLDMSVLAQS